ASDNPLRFIDPEGTNDTPWYRTLGRRIANNPAVRRAMIVLGFSIGQGARPATPPPPTPPPIEAPAGPTNPDGPPEPFETDRLRRHIEDERIRIDGTTGGGSSPPPPPRPRPRRPSARAQLDQRATRIA